MSSLLRTISVLLVITGTSLALKCYDDNTENNVKPTKTIECDRKFCSKSVLVKDKDTTLNSYRCDNMDRCQNEGCYVEQYGVVVCCCSKDFCNSSSKISAIFAVVPVILLKLLA
ncbi:hypothetical protein Y032_0559g3453 [Ancylostoma ceylanicum]|uniref:Uncharacterized protein n=1 Tax=Ancylostoma ceylanicum TaxID=53326 RepID=A0A016WPH0_9BILA|nr:hypothetical protein Y032_0559g3453 [Ancylostoma ceylanicum]